MSNPRAEHCAECGVFLEEADQEQCYRCKKIFCDDHCDTDMAGAGICTACKAQKQAQRAYSDLECYDKDRDDALSERYNDYELS